MLHFSEKFFRERLDFADLEQTIASTMRLAAQKPISFYLFFQRYTYFNAYASSLIPRLVSSIALSRYLFIDPDISVAEQADRGMQLAAKVMIAAADEGAYGVSHRSLAQGTLKTVGDYTGLAAEERNQLSRVPAWLDEIVDALIAGYQGTPGDIASLVQAIGFHAASEMFGDREYALLDMVVRYENREIGFDRYLREKVSHVIIEGHRYDPWCYVLIHSKHESSGVEIEHAECALEVLNLLAIYLKEPESQIQEWVFQGFNTFVELQQRLFREIYRECLELVQNSEITPSTVA
jgi:hypothetical protein